VIWLRKAAEQGDAAAQNKLGFHYFNGRGCLADEAIAARWFAKAAEQGNHNAQSNLASLYRLGRGVHHDLNRAYMWRLLSLQGTDSRQDAELQGLAAAMGKGEVAEAESRASDLLQSHRRTEPRTIEPTFVMLH